VKKRGNLDLAKSIKDLHYSMWFPTKLHEACYRKNIMGIQELISDVNFQKSNLSTKDYGGWTPLHLCAFNGDIESLATLIDAGANPFILSEHHHTPLHLACSRGFHDAVKAILLKCRTTS
jgi:ankyrin repeat protein